MLLDFFNTLFGNSIILTKFFFHKVQKHKSKTDFLYIILWFIIVLYNFFLYICVYSCLETYGVKQKVVIGCQGALSQNLSSIIGFLWSLKVF